MTTGEARLSVAMWNAIQLGDWNRAHELYGILVSANTTVTELGFTYGHSVLREGLHMRGYNVKVILVGKP